MSPNLMFELWEENPEVCIVNSVHSTCIIYQNSIVGCAENIDIEAVQIFLWEKNLFVILISSGEILYAGGYESELERRLGYSHGYDFSTGPIQDMIEVLNNIYWDSILTWIITKNKIYSIDYVSLVSLTLFSVGPVESEDELWFKLVEKYDGGILETLKNLVSLKGHLKSMSKYRGILNG